MAEFAITLEWKRESDSFTFAAYNRNHLITFGGGERIAASAAPGYRGDASLVNPEESFAASLSSCHMLTFLAIAAKHRFIVDSYYDRAIATIAKNDQGRMAVACVTLQPLIRFSGDARPDEQTLARMHEQAHDGCFIANSIVCEVRIEPRRG
jgi:organic hydroperoxide reductase OsmC/OhrA